MAGASAEGAASRASQGQTAASRQRIAGANDRIRIGSIGVGGNAPGEDRIRDIRQLAAVLEMIQTRLTSE